MKARLLILLLTFIFSVIPSHSQSLCLRHRNGKATVVALSEAPIVRTAEDNISVTSAGRTKTFDKDDVLSILFQSCQEDVNRDFNVDISDVVSVINTIAGSDAYKESSDVNGDKKTDISDIVAIINSIAGKSEGSQIPSFEPDHSSAIGDAIYIYRNDGEFNAFLRYEVEQITFDVGNSLIQTADSTYAIPLSSIDSLSFVQLETVYKPDVVLMDVLGQTKYLKSAEGMTLTFGEEMPAGLRPKKGNIIITSDFSNPIFEEGFIGKINSAKDYNGEWIVECDSVYDITEIYERLISVETFGSEQKDNNSSIRKINNELISNPQKINLNLGIDCDSISLNGSIDGSYIVVVEYNITHKEQYINLRLIHDWNYGVKLNCKLNKDFGIVFGKTFSLPAIYFPQPTPFFKFQVAGCPFVKGGGELGFNLSFNSPVYSYTSGVSYRNGVWSGYHRKNKLSQSNSPSFETEFALDGNVHGGCMIDFWLGTIKAARSYIRTGLDFYIGPKLDGNVSMKFCKENSKDYYSLFKDSKVNFSWFTVDYEFFGEAALLGHKLPRNVFSNGTLMQALSSERHLLPEFSILSIAKDDTNKSVTIKTTPSGHLIFPLKLGIGIYDKYGMKVLSKYEKRKYWDDNSGFTISQYFDNLNGLDEYIIRPVIQIFGIEIPALPEERLTFENLCPDSNHPHAIDLGIGVKWSCCNVGASAPWEDGGYYAWGETEEKNTYSNDTYAYFGVGKCNSIGSDIAGTKYDVAHTKWGNGWCMPNQSQMELLNSKCTNEWTTINGVNGRKYTGPNGASIFLPASGDKLYNDVYDVDNYGYYWSSTQVSDVVDYAHDIFFHKDNSFVDYSHRSYGRSVRPVMQ